MQCSTRCIACLALRTEPGHQFPGCWIRIAHRHRTRWQGTSLRRWGRCCVGHHSRRSCQAVCSTCCWQCMRHCTGSTLLAQGARRRCCGGCCRSLARAAGTSGNTRATPAAAPSMPFTETACQPASRPVLLFLTPTPAPMRNRPPHFSLHTLAYQPQEFAQPTEAPAWPRSLGLLATFAPSSAISHPIARNQSRIRGLGEPATHSPSVHTHWPAWQAALAPQACPHAPQFLESVSRLTHPVEQKIWGA